MYSLMVLVFLVAVQFSHALFEYTLAKSFLEFKYCKRASYFGCSTKQEEIEIMKRFMNDDIRISMFSVSNMTFANVLSQQDYLIGVILDGDCPNIEPFLAESANLKFIFDIYHWLIFSSNYEMINTFENVNLFINADVSVVVPNNTGKLLNWTIMDVYNPARSRGGDLKVTNAGFYNEEDGLNIQLVWNRYYQRQNMTGTVFKAGMVIPYHTTMSLDDYLRNHSDRNNNTFSRFNVVAVQLCQDFYNFSTIRTCSNSWGFIQDDGVLDGLAGALANDEVDFGLSALLYKSFRLTVIDYGYGNWVMRSTFFFRHPKSTSSSHELYLQPLQGSVWISTFIVVVLMIVLSRIVVRHEITVYHQDCEKSSLGENSWSFAVVYNIGELCQQGFSYIPFLISGRILVLSVLMFFFLIFQFYSASVVSFLLLPPKRTITSVADLVKSSLEVGMDSVLYDVDYMKTTTDPVAIALYNKKIKQPNNQLNFLKPREGLAKVRAGGYAFHTQTSTAYSIIEATFEEKAVCELVEAPLYQPIYSHMALSKKSPLREMFLYCNLQQLEVGIMHRLRLHWNSRKPQCFDCSRYLEIEVELSESSWALALLGVGVGGSLCLLILEHVWKRWGGGILDRISWTRYFAEKADFILKNEIPHIAHTPK
ncbi:glutamate [NMDA] receptor subunit 1-like [Photinus pyralis]|uniref:glutamate [NMDA] receptor subunit 1-like n=1 Tax=Photinus pyralis TaxID=7054 RepID=UPI0012676A23|nr:glutamate [NMDA] receptor subunit 1-like [Photinus pyralis]